MIKNRVANLKELKVKAIIIAVLFAVVVLSFFFAKNLEAVFGLNETFDANQVSENAAQNSDYSVSYIDVGEGNSCFVRFPDGKTMLVDGGGVSAGETVVEFLKDNAVEKIDYLIATHADSDHIGGLVSVLQNFDVKNIYRSFQISGKGTSASEFEVSEYEDLKPVYLKLMQETGGRSEISRVTTDIFEEFVKLIYEESYIENGKKIFSTVTVFYDGLKIVNGNYSFEFFAPLKRDSNINLEGLTDNTKGFATIGYGVTASNENSAIFLLSIYDDTFLFTGDASFDDEVGSKFGNFAEDDFINSLTNDEKEKLSEVSVYLAGHHGSKNSSSEKLLELISPKFVVFSVGKNNDYGHPSPEVLDRIQKSENLEEDYLLRTDKDGTITFLTVDGELCYSTSLYNRDESLTMSWYEIGGIIFISISYIVVFIKPKQKKQI